MDSSRDGLEPEKSLHIDRLAAAGMLRRAESVSRQAHAGIDSRVQPLIKAWTPVVLFVYAATFLLLFTDAGSGLAANPASAASYANILLIPLLAGLMLVQGLRNRLPIAEVNPLRGRRLLFFFLGILVFMAVPAASFFGVGIPWWLCLLVAAALALIAGLSTNAWPKRTLGGTVDHAGQGPRPPLVLSARWATAGLGLYFGFTGATLVFSWFPLAAFILTILLLVLMGFANARWGLTSLGSQWMKRQWVACALSASLLFCLALIVVKAGMHEPLAGMIGGLLIATPLGAVALMPGRRQ